MKITVRSRNLIWTSILVGFQLILIPKTLALPAFASEPPPGVTEPTSSEPQMPDLSHEHLAAHAAQSHGNTAEQTAWIAQGAYAEDHQLIPTFGWHSWDPDTGNYWWSPLGSGPALERAAMLFEEAVALFPADPESAWKLLGQSLHLLQDVSTPAHAHADSHVCIGGIGDCDAYEVWLGESNLENTWAWIIANPPAPRWDFPFRHIPTWDQLSDPIKIQLELANTAYGGFASGQELWISGPTGIHPINFQLMFLMAEVGDDFNSGGSPEMPGEVYNLDLSDPANLVGMRDTLFPNTVRYSTAWIDIFEYRVGFQDAFVFLPLVMK